MFDSIPKVVGDCCADLFAAYALPLERVGEASNRPEVCAVLGTTGDLQGTAILATTIACVNATNPVGDSRGWISELVNQLVGRIKNELLRHRIEIVISTPVALRGDRLAPVGGGEVFRSPAGEVHVWFDFEPAEGAAWQDTADDTAVASEGDVLLF
jgi:hypothetical protein|nr:hypothetical protein [Kofleriaceae bacterium]